MTKSLYELIAYDKQGKAAFIAHYQTFKQACEVSDYLKSTALYSQINISNPDGLGELEDE